MKKVKETFVVVLLIALFLFVFLKFSVIEVWLSEDYQATYSLYGVDKRVMIISIFENNEVLVYYADESGYEEWALTKMKGTLSKHIIGNIWKLEGPPNFSSFFGYRIFEKGVLPIYMEITTIDKSNLNESSSVFESIGSSGYQLILFGNNRINFQGMWFEIGRAHV